jgi:benzoyl-CoA reductase/2-hydroxyglutaryl-CoA dehydratase subunit BcrC/BadD/HgdB
VKDSDKSIQNFVNKIKALQQSAKKDKKNNFLGLISGYVPEEIILAAGFIPFRIPGTSPTISLSKAYFSGNVSSYAQAYLESSLKGECDFLKGIIIGGETDTMKRLYDAWLYFSKNQSFFTLLDIPKFITPDVIRHYKESLLLLIKKIENSFNVVISDNALSKAVLVCQKTRDLLNDLNDLRKASTPVINALQMYEICKLSVSGDKDIFNDELKALLNYLRTHSTEKPASACAKPRLLLTGSLQEGTELLSIIENSGGCLVCEDLDNRIRHFRNSVCLKSGEDPLTSIVTGYFRKPPSASVSNLDRRAEYILELVKEFKIDGIIYHVLKFDDPYIFEFPWIKDFLAQNNVPVIRIETEIGELPKGQITTRIQAFIDMLFSKRNTLQG